jgi:outer membrane protein assembly factor BamA
MAEDSVVSTPDTTVIAEPDEDEPKTSPWLAIPMISSDPKVGTSGGGMVGYLFKLDPESTSSMIGIGATYSTTDSFLGGVFLRTFWDQDRKRLVFFGGGGKIHNDYKDFLGSGLPVQTTDNVKVFQGRYLQQVKDKWFAGVKATYTNYLISSKDSDVNDALESLGLTGFDSVALGLVAMYDSRNNQNTPSSGIRFLLDNFAYRKAFGGDENFDTYNMKYSHYIPHGNGNVLAYRVNSRWTSDASPGGYSSVALRGYTRGQYLAPHSTMIEVEERWHLKGRYGVNLFAGLASLYGNGLKCTDSDNLYPSIGIGGQIMIKEAEQIVITLDAAFGESGNKGFYIRFGQAF